MILIVGCQSVTNQAFEEDPELNFTSTKIIPSYDQHSMSLLSGVFTKGKIVEQGGYFASDAGNIDLSKALKVQELKDGTVRYTFRVETNDPLIFENLIIRETKDGRVTSYLLRYQPDHVWLAENGGSFNFESFTGILIARTTEGKNLMQVTFVNGESTSFYAPENKGKSMTENCEDGGDGSGSTGGGGSTDGGYGDTGGGYDGGDGGYNDGSGTSGGTSGGGDSSGDDGGGGSGYAGEGCYWYTTDGALIINCPVVELEEDPDIIAKTNTVCDPIDEVHDGECMDEECDPDPVGIIIDPADLDPCLSDDPPAYCECEDTGNAVLDNPAVQMVFEDLWNKQLASNKEQGGFLFQDGNGDWQFFELVEPRVIKRTYKDLWFHVPSHLPEGSIYIHTHPPHNSLIKDGITMEYPHEPSDDDRDAMKDMYEKHGVAYGVIIDPVYRILMGSDGKVINEADRCGY